MTCVDRIHLGDLTLILDTNFQVNIVRVLMQGTLCVCQYTSVVPFLIIIKFLMEI